MVGYHIYINHSSNKYIIIIIIIIIILVAITIYDIYTIVIDSRLLSGLCSSIINNIINYYLYT